MDRHLVDWVKWRAKPVFLSSECCLPTLAHQASSARLGPGLRSSVFTASENSGLLLWRSYVYICECMCHCNTELSVFMWQGCDKITAIWMQ